MKTMIVMITIAGMTMAQVPNPGMNGAGGGDIRSAPPTVPSPRITTEQQVAYFQALADLTQNQAAVMQSQVAVQAAVKAMTDVCPLALDENKRPQCKPEPKVVIEPASATEAAKPTPKNK